MPRQVQREIRKLVIISHSFSSPGAVWADIQCYIPLSIAGMTLCKWRILLGVVAGSVTVRARYIHIRTSTVTVGTGSHRIVFAKLHGRLSGFQANHSL